MKKQFSKSSKHSFNTSKSTLREINEIIINTFTRIEELNHNEKSINKELGWLAEELEKNWEIINAVHIATLLNNLGNLEINDQSLADTVINLTLKKCTELLTRTQTSIQYTTREIGQIFNALPKLPTLSAKYKTLLLLLLERATLLASRATLDVRDSTNILDGIAKLGIDLDANRTLIKNLLGAFEATKDFFSTIEATSLSQLWQFCIYAKTQITSERIEGLTILINNELTSRTKETPTPSLFQSSIYNLLLKLLKDEFKEKIIEEYPSGSYFLDIAFPEQKINIEVDGPYHYRDGKLKRIHRFRDFILQAYEDWKIIRIPHFEWEQLGDDTQAKIDYLLKKLANYSYLLNQTSLERLEKLKTSTEITSNSYTHISSVLTTSTASTSSSSSTSSGIAQSVKTSSNTNLLKSDSPSDSESLKEYTDNDYNDEDKLDLKKFLSN